MPEYWLWVTNRETIYASDLENHKDEAWTCDERTKDGDLILLYCNSKGKAIKGYPKSVFCYLMQAISDAYDGEDFPGWRENGWKWACNSQVLYAFRNPVTFKDLKIKDAEFKNWDAYGRRNFQGRSFKIPEDIWRKLDQMASERDPIYPGYQKFIAMPDSPSCTERDFTASEYVSAFHSLQLPPHYMQMLLTHYYAPNQTLTATMMAKALGYENFNAANLHYGMLGGLIGKKLGWNPLPEFKVNVLVDFKKDKELLWIMKPVVAEAIKLLGWDEDASTIPEEIEVNENKPIYEGAVKRISINAYERSTRAREECLLHYGCKCSVCDINLSDIYGEIAQGHIHVHHLMPLSEINSEYQIDPIADLRPICPNCHYMIHLNAPPNSIEELREMINSNRKRHE
jgi:predicted HNH restriction endonuclease